jgi:cathepsin L
MNSSNSTIRMQFIFNLRKQNLKMKVFLVIIPLIVLSIVEVCCSERSNLIEWNQFKAKHGKTFENLAEEVVRMHIWMENKKAVDRHNKLFAQGKVSYTKAINKFSAMTDVETEKFYVGFDAREFNRKQIVIKSSTQAPDEVDWRNHGAVTEVKDQGHFASSWAFSAVGAVEGQYFLNTGSLVTLSEQQIHDCVGDSSDVRSYIVKTGSIETETAYPRTNDTQACYYNEHAAAATVQGFQDIEQSEEALKNAVASIGPISVAISADRESFQFYSGGVYDEPNCGTLVDHAVLVIGYGNENGKDFWLVKNSWGKDWGDNGYIKMARNRNNQCAIASYANFPTGVGRKNSNGDRKRSFMSSLLMAIARRRLFL